MTTIRPGGVNGHGRSSGATRRGAHRARPTGLAAALPTLAVVLVVAVVVLATWALVSNGIPGTGGESAGANAGTASATATDATTAATATATPSPSGTPDRTTPLRVLNNTNTSGLARKAGQALTDNGWNVKEIGNSQPRGAVKQTTVFYALDTQAATAAAVADELGAQVSQDAALAQKGITVVLAADYQP